MLPSVLKIEDKLCLPQRQSTEPYQSRDLPQRAHCTLPCLFRYGRFGATLVPKTLPSPSPPTPSLPPPPKKKKEKKKGSSDTLLSYMALEKKQS